MLERVMVVDPERMNLLGLLLRSLLQRKLADRSGQRLARWIRGDVHVVVGEMQVTLAFEGDLVRITRSQPVRPVVRIEGTMAALADAALSRNRVRSFLRGQLRVTGSPRAAICLLMLMRA